ncbi:mediator of RNA polymerase II transcription subunit 7-like [Branchiostoma floridae x Branchiostoma belcheri]
MAEGEGEAGVSAMPLPPMQFVSQYTNENVSRGLAPAPPPPITDQYSMFGSDYQVDDQIIRPLESQGIRRLHPDKFDHKLELKKLNHSILVNFLDLLDILIKSPNTPRREEKIDDLNLLFIHMHHLINEYRPHQARETLRVMMEVQKRQRLETADRFQQHLDRVIDMLKQCVQSLPEDIGGTPDGEDVKPNLQELNRQAGIAQSKRDEDYGKDRLMCSIVDNIKS